MGFLFHLISEVIRDYVKGLPKKSPLIGGGLNPINLGQVRNSLLSLELNPVIY